MPLPWPARRPDRQRRYSARPQTDRGGAARNPESARYVHRGATSQDIMDTAVVLRLRAAGKTGRRPHARNERCRGVGARARGDADARPHRGCSMPAQRPSA